MPVKTGWFFIDFPLFLIQLTIVFLIELLCSLIPDSLRAKQTLTGRTVLLTGAGSGIGRDTCLQFAKQSCKLILWDINEAANEETAELIRTTGGTEPILYTVDVADREQVEKMAGLVIGQHKIDILVLNAGISYYKELRNLTHDEIDKIFSVNYFSYLWMIKLFLPVMKTQEYGHIILLSSITSHRGVAKSADYSSTKAGIARMANSIMEELQYDKCNHVNISIVYPALVKTPMTINLFNDKESSNFLTPERVAVRIVEGMRINRNNIVIPGFGKLYGLLNFLCPVTFINVFLPLILSKDS